MFVPAGGSGGAGPLPAVVAVGEDGPAGDSPALAALRSSVGTFIRDFSAKLISVSTSRAVASATAGIQGQLKGALDSLHTVAETQRTLGKCVCRSNSNKSPHLKIVKYIFFFSELSHLCRL